MRIDIVIPAHNEEDRIDRMLRAYRASVSEPNARFLVAMDSCTDGTAEVVRAHMDVDPRVELLSFPKLGKGGVIMESFRHCDAEVIGFVDADCATPPAEFLRLVEVAQRADGAIASRAHPASVLPARRARGRGLASWVFARLTRFLFRLPFGDTQCGAKVVRRQVIDEVLPLLSSRDFLFDVDLLITANRLGYRIVEVPTVWVDQEGSHLSAGGDAGRMALSSFSLWLHHRVAPIGRAHARDAA
ncbi:MAG TPA: glycosyltransferase [Acidimicrobiales bacterium]|jgi:glycosyltransferase involved in cell wall biosynthesis|nr:glycosyltransferase [Acidimicrobiales bacterium]